MEFESLTHDEQNVVNKLLDLKCSETSVQICVGDVVALHNWGMSTSDEVIAYGRVEWDSQNKSFDINISVESTRANGIETNYEIDDEIWRTNPRLLRENEVFFD